MTPMGAAPERYDEGTVVYADGTAWNPGGGKGLYYWDGAQWVLTAGGGGGVTDHAALTGRDAADQHPISAITGLQTALDGKAESVHGHVITDVSGLQTALDGKAALTHGHAIADVSGLQAALDGKEPGLGNPSSNGQVLASTTGGARSWVDLPAGGGGGASWGYYYATTNFAGLSFKLAVPFSSASEIDPDGLASTSSNVLTIAAGGNYLVQVACDFEVTATTSTRRFRLHIDRNFTTFWSNSGDIASNGTKGAVVFNRAFNFLANDQLSVAVEDDSGVFGSFTVNVHLSLLKLG
jgi:hypothetical protein